MPSFRTFLDQCTIPLLFAVFFIAASASYWQLNALSQAIIFNGARSGCAMLAASITNFRQLYTKEVVNRVMPHGFEVTHDYLNKPKAIPLPATLTIALGRAVSKTVPGLEVRLYSEYPFPWRKETGGVRDDFERKAIDYLKSHKGEQDFYCQEDTLDGQPVFRYARPDVMKESCVHCHNTHPDSPKKDWRVGDLRGVLEVIRPMAPVIDQTNGLLRGIYIVAGTVGVLIFLGLLFVINRLRKSKASLSGEVQKAIGSLVGTVTEISSAASQLSVNTQQTAAAVTENMAAVAQVRQMAEISSKVARSLNKDAQQMVSVSTSAKSDATESAAGIAQIQAQMESILSSISSLSEKTQKISDIIAAVDDIAERSTLLSVNAAIEAARAGDMAGGFVVLAKEIKDLSNQSRNETQNVRQVLELIAQSTQMSLLATKEGKEAVEQGAKLVLQVQEALMQTAGMMQATVDTCAKIQTSSDQQVNGMKQISESTAQIEESCRTNRDSAETLREAAQKLTDLSKRLGESLSD
jgi:methyl-accepting chemotaxis protein